MQAVNAYWREQIQQLFPDLEIETIEMHQEGLVNDVFIVNQAWVIRITKTEWGQELMDQEHRLLQLLQSELSMPTPRSEKRGEDVLIYPYLTGESFFRETWLIKDTAVQQALADQLGRFLAELHHIGTRTLGWEIPLTLAPVTRETWVDIYERLDKKVSPLLLPHQEEWMRALFANALDRQDFFDFDPVLIHGDLAPYHILYSPKDNRINAVIDFGTAGMGDPATDLGCLISSYGESLVGKIAPQYPEYQDLLPRARFYAQAIELQWVLLGVETNEYYWFTSHLGGARDIGSEST